MWILGQPVEGTSELAVRNPYTGDALDGTTFATAEQVERAVGAADALRQTAAGLTLAARADALERIADAIEERAEEFAELMTAEAAKPLSLSRGEVGRAISVFRIAAEETRRWSGEVMRLDAEAAGEGRLAYIARVPRGPVLAITPFNFPLNLVAHKVAPAIAVGSPVIVKPAPKTPLSALLLGEVLAASGLPEGMTAVLNVPDTEVVALVADPRLAVVSFTGSGRVGWSIRRSVPEKQVLLELGGNAAVVVAADWSRPEDLERAAERIALFANAQAGQSCISVQRVLVADTVYEEFRALLIRSVEALAVGDPAEEATQVGPLINAQEAERVETWISAALSGGATLVTGGVRDGCDVSPAVLEAVPTTSDLWRQEAFGPVLTLTPFSTLDEAVRMVNDSVFGLQAGVFTHDLSTAFRMHRELDVGGVIVGDVPTYRSDRMPYGGMKQSGVGREGVTSTMRDFTEERTLVLTGLEL
jgi:acyl-CoA reductase-like NAD-dependent aldehyde dehydrogenase